MDPGLEGLVMFMFVFTMSVIVSFILVVYYLLETRIRVRKLEERASPV